MSDTKGGDNFEGLGKLLNHNYDDIRELDNPLPGWWLVTFYATVIFSLGYYAYYEFMGGPTLDEELSTAMQKIEATVQQTQPSGDAGATDFNALLADTAAMAKGKEHYDGKCAACHGPQGQGLIGPNLTDTFWIHGDGSMASMHPVVANGVLEKGMPAWTAVIPPAELNAVVAYVHTLKGTNPPNPKAPQGNEVK